MEGNKTLGVYITPQMNVYDLTEEDVLNTSFTGGGTDMETGDKEWGGLL